jgi:hypothetical protein
VSSDVKVVTITGAAALARQGLFPTRDALIGVTEHGAAIYAWDKTIIVRPQGPRPDGAAPLRARTLPPTGEDTDLLIGIKKPRTRKRSK